MRLALIILAMACVLSPVRAQSSDAKPTDAKALKMYNSAVQLMSERQHAAALGEFEESGQAGWLGIATPARNR